MADEPGPEAPVPSTPLIFLDVDDEITSAAARVRSAGSDEVALVLPYGSRLATSRINFRLLAREAGERGKHIQIVSADASARALAAAAGLTVHPSVAAFEGHRSGAPASGNGTEARAGDGPGEPGSDGAAAATAPVAAPGREDDTRTRVLTRPRKRAERVPIVGPPRPPMRTGLAVGLGLALVVLVAAGGLLALEVLPKATIVLAPRSAPVGPVALTVDARLDAEAPDPEALVIPAQRVPFELRAEGTVTATGVKVTETPATGEVTFSNFDTGSPNRVDKGSVVSTESGIGYRTLGDVTLPPARLQFPFTVVPSTSTIGVEAVAPGPEGNVGNNSITVVPDGENRRLLQVSNDEATAGGSRVESPEISEDDVDAAVDRLRAALALEFDRQVAARTGVPAGVVIFAQTKELDDEPAFSPEPASLVGMAGPEADLTVVAMGSVLGVDPGPIETLAGARLQARVPPGWTLAPGSTAFELGVPFVFGEVVSYPVTIAATQVHDVDREALLLQVRGRVVAEARSILEEFGDVEIAVWPDWVTTIPKNADQIELTLAAPRPAASSPP